MYVAKSVVLLVLFPVVVFPQLANEVLFRQNLNQIRTLGKCGPPRVRLVYAADHPDSGSNSQYIPPAAVVHRCESSGGCCFTPGQICKPAAEEQVKIVFNVKTVFDGQISQSYRALTFTNHTICECMNINEQPR